MRSSESAGPFIFISYAHADEPEKPAEGEVQWLSFVRRFLQPAVKYGIFDLWVDRQMAGGANWGKEIEDKLPACDIFILLVSASSMASYYIIDKEIAIRRSSWAGRSTARAPKSAQLRRTSSSIGESRSSPSGSKPRARPPRAKPSPKKWPNVVYCSCSMASNLCNM